MKTFILQAAHAASLRNDFNYDLIKSLNLVQCPPSVNFSETSTVVLFAADACCYWPLLLAVVFSLFVIFGRIRLRHKFTFTIAFNQTIRNLDCCKRFEALCERAQKRGILLLFF